MRSIKRDPKEILKISNIHLKFTYFFEVELAIHIVGKTISFSSASPRCCLEAEL